MNGHRVEVYYCRPFPTALFKFKCYLDPFLLLGVCPLLYALRHAWFNSGHLCTCSASSALVLPLQKICSGQISTNQFQPSSVSEYENRILVPFPIILESFLFFAFNEPFWNLACMSLCGSCRTRVICLLGKRLSSPTPYPTLQILC